MHLNFEKVVEGLKPGFLTAMLPYGLRNCFSIWTYISLFIWTFVSLFYLDFSFSIFCFNFFPFFSIVFLFYYYSIAVTFWISFNFFILFSTKGSVSEVDNGCLQKPAVKSRVLDQPKSPQKIAKAQSFLRPIPKLVVPFDDSKVKNVPSPIPLPKGVTSEFQFWFNFFLLKTFFIAHHVKVTQIN